MHTQEANGVLIERPRQALDLCCRAACAQPTSINDRGLLLRMMVVVAAIIVTLLCTDRAYAQRPTLPGLMRYFSGPSNSKIQVELRTQRAQMVLVFALRKDLADQYRNARSLRNDRSFDYAETLKKIERTGNRVLFSILSEKQTERLRGIHYQQLGTAAFQEPAVRKLLGLTGKQQELIDRILESDADDREKKVITVLTDSQRGKWKKAIGKPVDLPRSRS